MAARERAGLYELLMAGLLATAVLRLVVRVRRDLQRLRNEQSGAQLR